MAAASHVAGVVRPAAHDTTSIVSMAPRRTYERPSIGDVVAARR